MIKKLKSKFILLSSMAMLVLLSAIVCGMNIINYQNVIEDADQVLEILSENRGSFPEFDFDMEFSRPKNMSPELPYESRYFSVLLSQNGNVIQVETSRIKAVSTEDAIQFSEKAFQKNQTDGFISSYRYHISEENDTVRITFLDCGRTLDAYNDFLFASILMALAGLALFIFVIAFFSEKILAPIAESYEKQKRFITDAGHEIKTPLTIINADLDVLSMDIEDNEWVDDIKRQTERLSTLTKNLVYLSKMEEDEHALNKIDFCFSDAVSESAESFHALALTQNKTLNCAIEPMLTLCGDENAIRQLVSILLENALKYSPANSTIDLKVQKRAKQIELSVHNVSEVSVPKEDLSQIFERFYRLDASRSSLTGGHGIGLSIAKAVALAHHGKIKASTTDGHSLEITVNLPIS